MIVFVTYVMYQEERRVDSAVEAELEASANMGEAAEATDDAT